MHLYRKSVADGRIPKRQLATIFPRTICRQRCVSQAATRHPEVLHGTFGRYENASHAQVSPVPAEGPAILPGPDMWRFIVLDRLLDLRVMLVVDLADFNTHHMCLVIQSPIGCCKISPLLSPMTVDPAYSALDAEPPNRSIECRNKANSRRVCSRHRQALRNDTGRLCMSMEAGERCDVLSD